MIKGDVEVNGIAPMKEPDTERAVKLNINNIHATLENIQLVLTRLSNAVNELALLHGIEF